MATRLGDRLRCALRLLDDAPGLILDVGFDHGALLSWLAGSGRAALGIEPLAGACRAGRAAGLPVLRSRGLAALAPGAARQAVFAGLGEATILEILASAPLVFAGLARVVAVPAGSPAGLRPFLAERGWRLASEDLVEERGRFYPALAAVPGHEPARASHRIHLGPRLAEPPHPRYRAWLADCARRQRAALTGPLPPGPRGAFLAALKIELGIESPGA